MSVNVTEITTVADALMIIADKHLGTQFDKQRIKNDTYGQAYSNVLIAIIQSTSSLVQDQPIKDAQVALSTSQKASIDSEITIKETQSVKDLLIKDAQVALSTSQKASIDSEKTIKENQSVKDLLIKDAQVALSTSQKASIDSEKTIKENQSVKDLAVKEAQAALISEQKTTELKKQALTDRQKTAYDDQLRIKEAEQLAGVVQMGYAGGTTVPDSLVNSMLTAVNAITP